MDLKIAKFFWQVVIQLAVVYSYYGFATNDPKPLPNLILRGFNGEVAEDLTLNGELISPGQIRTIREQMYAGHLDLSKLNPLEDPEVWTDRFYLGESSNVNQADKVIKVDEYSSVEFKHWSYDVAGQARFIIEYNNELYLVSLGPYSAQENMRKTLLRKIGYQIPALKRLGKLRVEFQGENQKVSFLSQLEYQLAQESASQWVIGQPNDNTSIIIQDINIEPLQAKGKRNLAIIPLISIPGQFRHRRVLSSLLIPYNLLYFNRSVNLMSWRSGRVVSENIELNFTGQQSFAHPDLFNCTFEDAQWIITRINQLSRKDWEEVVAAAELPAAVEMLLVEKIIARRNSQNQLFKVDSPDLPVNQEVSLPPHLIDGKLMTAQFTGYALDFLFGDPDSPFSGSERVAYIWNQVIHFGSLIASQITNQLVNKVIPINTDTAALNDEGINNIIAEKTTQALATGEPQALTLSQWSHGSFDSNIIFNRTMVAGPFQGVDTTHSQVDMIAVSASIGLFTGLIGLNGETVDQLGRVRTPDRVVNFSGAGITGQAYFSRFYAHIRPVYNVSAANKTPFKNVLVPIVKRNIGRILPKAGSKSKEAPISSIILEDLAEFKRNLKIGESFIITDTIGGSLGQQIRMRYYIFNQPTRLQQVAEVINRIHIIRRDENTLQIYKNRGYQLDPLRFDTTVNAGVPLIRLEHRSPSLWGNTDFQTVNLSESIPVTPERVKELAGVRDALTQSSIKRLNEVKSPYKIQFQGKERFGRLGLTSFTAGKISSKTKLKITGPRGHTKKYSRHYDVQTQGRNHMEYGIDALNTLTQSWLNHGVNIRQYSLNPGLTPTGRALNKVTSLEIDEDNPSFITGRFSRVYNGFYGKTHIIAERIKRLSDHYHHDFFRPEVLANTLGVFLYRVGVHIQIHPEGFQQMMKLQEDALKNIFILYDNNHQRSQVFNRSPTRITAGQMGKERWKNMLVYQKQFDRAAGNHKRRMKVLTRAFKFAEKNLTLHGLQALLGPSNMMAYASIDGFRDGVEFNLDNPLELSTISDSVGQYSRHGTMGPLSVLMRPQTSGGIYITEGELFIGWLMRRVF